MLYIEVLPEPDRHDGEAVPLLLAPVAVRQPAPAVSVLLHRTVTPLEEASVAVWAKVLLLSQTQAWACLTFKLDTDN